MIRAEIRAIVGAAETALRAAGLRQVRVRHHGTLARIELGRENLPRLLAPAAARAAARAVRRAGYARVGLDLGGYRQGSLLTGRVGPGPQSGTGGGVPPAPGLER